MNNHLRTMLTGLLLLLSFGLVQAADTPVATADLKIEIVVSAETGWPTRLVITGNNPLPVAWLGVSLYPYGVADPISGGRHSILEVPKGDIHQEITIDPALLGGSFEFALWGRKVARVDCKRDYCYWCKVNGFHVDESLVYRSGLLTRLTGYK